MLHSKLVSKADAGAPDITDVIRLFVSLLQ